MSLPTITPYAWQAPSVNRLTCILRAGNFAIDASDTGTGKTVVAIAAMQQLRQRFLVVCPKSVKTAWARTAESMGASGLLLGVVNPERLQRENPYFKQERWALPADVCIVWDEVHKGASGPKAKTTRILATAKPQGLKVLTMSATIADSPLKMRAIGYLAGLHPFRTVDYFNWCRENGCFKMEGINGLMFPKGPSGRRHMENLHRQLSTCMTRIRIAEVPDFPETFVQANLYDLESRYTDEINLIYADMSETLRKPAANKLVESLRARQRVEAIKVPLLTDLMLDAHEEGHSVVMFVNFRDTLDALRKAVTERGIPVGWVWGQGQSEEERQGFVDAFAEDRVEIMLCMSQAGGLGLNLHGRPGFRPRISFLTPSFSASDFIQCLGRIHRAGGTKSTQTVVLAANTIEERVHDAIQGKLGNLRTLVDGDLV